MLFGVYAAQEECEGNGQSAAWRSLNCLIHILHLSFHKKKNGSASEMGQ